MAVKSAARPFTRKAGPSSRKPGQSIACQLGGDAAILTTTELQFQYMQARGLSPALAIIAAASFFGLVE